MSKIVFLGDSVTYGQRAAVTGKPAVAATDVFAYKVGAARGFTTTVNKGVPNDTSTQGLARFSTDVLAESPDALCIMFGINDIWAGTTVATYKSNLLSMVQQAKTAGIRPSLLTPNFVRGTTYIDAFPPYLDAIREVAKEEDVPLADCYLRFMEMYFLLNTTQFDLLWQDYQHPGVAGHQLITDWILKSYNSEVCA